ncbi:MAG TPA: orotidine-5'-phosphate decarboxylase [Spirochaetota bacterium]|nr:orotidine-5'-phosphate decarboxylase [Spirochaetota bacterium]HRZ27896.1 orotidine-5'-phosphate decarboxylase [Spirochaetota bacterium]HSA14433.1 orotidine-5'-phosphate decarboxylase [Spirochaetota bacterium]
MNYLNQLTTSAEKFKSIVCMGLDPVIEDIPVRAPAGEAITIFYQEILNKMVQSGEYPSAVKPNYAFYAQYGIEGILALEKIITLFKAQGIPVILDVKRGDIGKTAEAYAAEAFDFFKADAVTLSPYMGYDSISPFMKRKPDGGFYILTKTSNKSSGDLQDIEAGGRPLFLHTARKIIEWYGPGIGSVVGATYPQQLAAVSEIFINSGKDVPLLIPGVGSQGGDLEAVMSELKKFPDIRIHRINSSSAINYAYKKMQGTPYPEASVKALRELNDQINELSR